ncbi:MAG TPA: xanthine dehydrogenase family protein subunit M [Thermoanaerobaculia bacterium]|nr:xanthine dehydrogenase family protein subunit M [Thermoanaerobaculia bacterium]
MYPAPFEYVRASSVAEALALLGASEDAKLIAGGHSLIPMMKLRLAQPAKVIDIGRLDELHGIAIGSESARIGALTTHATIAASAELRERCPLITEAAHEIGDAQVRNRGTIGGNVAHADPGSDYPPVLRALGATIHLLGPGGERAVAAADFFVDLLTTDLHPDEIITAIELPVQRAGTGSAYLKFEHPASGYAVVGAAATLDVDGSGRVTGGGLAWGGVTATPLSGEAAIAALVGGDASDAAIESALAGLAAEDPLGDVFASGSYRIHVAKVYGRRALAAARDRAKGVTP